MSSRCHGSSGKQDSAKHKRKAGPSKAQTSISARNNFHRDGKGGNNKNVC